MSNRLPREFNFRHEVLPVVVVGILLNLVVHYLVEQQTRFLFADMGGTALVAILLGPWWAATVGVLSNAITGNYYTSYFPFGVVSIVGGLAWGYLARVPWIRASLFFGRASHPLRDFIYAYLILALVGGVVFGIFSSITKLVLYPAMGHPLHLNNNYYLTILKYIQDAGLTNHADVVGLLAADIIRDLADKSLMVLLALPFVQLMGFIPDAINRNKRWHTARNTMESLKTDAISILVFALTYTIYLLLARLLQPVINIRNAPQSIYWLKYPPVLMLLYAPIILAITAFLLLTYGPRSMTGRRVDTERRRRATLYNLLTSPARLSSGSLARSEFILLLKSDSIYGLLLTALLWPSKESAGIGPINSIAIYFGVMAIFASVFFYQRREFSERFCRANSSLITLRKWLAVPPQPLNSEPILRMLAHILSGHLEVSQSAVLKHAHIFYLPGIIISNEGYLYKVKQAKSNERLLLIIPDSPGILSGCVNKSIDEALTYTGSEAAIILTNSPMLFDDEAIRWLHEMDQQGRELILLGWEDIRHAIHENAKAASVDNILARGRIHIIESFAHHGSDDHRVPVDLGVEILARRSLASLQHILETLPRGSTVLDLGAGRGRHAVVALNLGHRVVAIERNQESFNDLTKFVAQLDDVDSRADLRCEDYLETIVETVGPVELVIITGVLQRTRDADDLRKNLLHAQSFASEPNSKLFIEMLFNMTFDGHPPDDGRFNWTQPVFEEILCTEFPSHVWRIERVRGPLQRHQSFVHGSRSFRPPAKHISSVSVEYLLSREA